MSFAKEQFKNHWQYHDFVSENLDKKAEILDFLEYIFNEMEEPYNIHFNSPHRIKYIKTEYMDDHGIMTIKPEFRAEKDYYSKERALASNGKKIF